MADKYYIMSKDHGDGPMLIGELVRTGNDEFYFQYLLGEKFPNLICQLPDMPDINKVYNRDETWTRLLRRVVPTKGSIQCREIMQDRGMKEEDYDVWNFLESTIAIWDEIMVANKRREPYHDSYEQMWFYKELPSRYHDYRRT